MTKDEIGHENRKGAVPAHQHRCGKCKYLSLVNSHEKWL